MVGTLAGSWSWSNRPGGSYWHFGLGCTGALWQCQDLRYRSAANLEGNWRVIPIETEDAPGGNVCFPRWSGHCGDVPSWTEAQIAKLVDLIEWLCRRYNIPAVLIPDTAAGRRGIAYHRQGIDPWRCSTCETWSNPGKCCPDWRRIGQIPRIVQLVQARLSPTQEWDEMATRAEVKAAVVEALNAQCGGISGIGGGPTPFATAFEFMYWGGRAASSSKTLVEALLDDVAKLPTNDAVTLLVAAATNLASQQTAPGTLGAEFDAVAAQLRQIADKVDNLAPLS
jgi:hypothetical protein